MSPRSPATPPCDVGAHVSPCDVPRLTAIIHQSSARRSFPTVRVNATGTKTKHAVEQEWLEGGRRGGIYRLLLLYHDLPTTVSSKGLHAE